METVLITLGVICILVGIIGSFIPIIPGLPVSYAGLVFLQFTDPTPFSAKFMVLWAVIVIIIMMVESLIPAYTTKRFGGSAYGITGAILGLIAGVFIFPPLGILLLPLLGAFLGEVVSGKKIDFAFRSAMGAFVGFLAGTILKVVTSLVMAYYFFIQFL